MGPWLIVTTRKVQEEECRCEHMIAVVVVVVAAAAAAAAAVVVVVVVVVMMMMMMIMTNLFHIAQFDTHGILTALGIKYKQTQYMHTWTYMKKSYSYIHRHIY